MPLRSLTRPVSLVASAAVIAGSIALAAPAAQAAPVFVDANTTVEYGAFAHDDSGSCTYTETATPDTTVPITENGAPVTVAANSTATLVNTGDAADTATVSGNATGTGKITSVGGNLGTMDLTVSGSATFDAALPTSQCEGHAGAYAELNFRFTVITAGFLTIDMSKTAGTYAESYLYQVDQDPYDDSYGEGFKVRTTRTIYLPAGTYQGYLEGEPEVSSSVDKVVTGSATLHAAFAVAGSTSSAVSGKAKKYVTFTGRACAAHALVPSLTTKKKKARKVKQVALYVNDVKVKKVKTPDKGDVFTLPVADDADVELRAVVKLFPKKPGRKGKVVEATASYVACL